jgi:hypothetical protein
MRFPGPEAEYFLDGGSAYLMRNTDSRLKIFFTASPGPEVDLVAWLERWKTCPGGGDCRILDQTWAYLDEDRARIEGDVFLEVSPMAYEQAIGTTMRLGEPPAWPEAGFNINTGSWNFSARWRGPLNEHRVQDSLNALASAYDENGTLLARRKAGFSQNGDLPPGRYRLESVNTTSIVAGMPATAVLTSWADSRNDDWLLPLFTGLRVVNEDGTNAQIVARNSNAVLLFSAADQQFERPYVRHVPLRDTTVVEYRAHGTSDWHPLPAVKVAAHFQNNSFLNGGVGTMYRVDLGAVTSSLTGHVDLRLAIGDVSGNTTEIVLAPAFAVSEPRRRPVTR